MPRNCEIESFWRARVVAKAIFLTIASIVVGLGASSAPWKNADPAHWTAQDLDQVLNNSPWAQSAGASFATADEDDTPAPPSIEVPQAGIPAPRNAASDGHWDGGVGKVNRNGPPSLNVTVRWESALPIREAQDRQHAAKPPFSAEEAGKNYVISVIGLVPAGGANAAKTGGDGSQALDARDLEAQNPQEMLDGVARNSRLFRRDGSPVRADSARIDRPTGTLYLLFPRADGLTLKDKEVTFQTRFGSLTVNKKFRLKDMQYAGRLEL